VGALEQRVQSAEQKAAKAERTVTEFQKQLQAQTQQAMEQFGALLGNAAKKSGKSGGKKSAQPQTLDLNDLLNNALGGKQ